MQASADEDAVSRLFDTAETTFGGVDVVVNAAGLMTLAPLADFDLAALDRMHRAASWASPSWIGWSASGQVHHNPEPSQLSAAVSAAR